MSERVRVHDGRRAPFLWASLAAMRHLRATLPGGQKVIGARNVYFGIAELAAERYDGQHDGFEATRAEIAEKSGVTIRRVSDHLATLDAVGLLEITARATLAGATMPSVYCLREPQISVQDAIRRFVDLEARRAHERGGDETSPHQERGGTLRRGDDTSSDEVSPPTRARLNRLEEVKEDGETEGPRAHTREAGASTPAGVHETAVVAELQALAADREARLDVGAVIDAVRAHPDIAHLTAAKRLREVYGSAGICGRRHIRNLAAIFAAELDQRTPAADKPARRGRQQQPTPSSKTAQRLVHHAPPEGMETPGEKLLTVWESMRAELRKAVTDSTWHLWLDQLEVAGLLTTLSTELGDEQETACRTIVLWCPPESAAWVAASFNRLLDHCASYVCQEPITVELAHATARRRAA